MSLPVLISVPHGGSAVPPELESLNLLTEPQILSDGDEGAARIYDLASEVATCVTTPIARAFVDLNRAEADRGQDGVVKTHTVWDEPVYREPLSEALIEQLLRRYYRPYHACLRRSSSRAKLGMDCHTMAAVGPPMGPLPDRERPLICLSNAEGTCSADWLKRMADSLNETFDVEVKINYPFKGGHIIRTHAAELPWMQLELSRANFLPFDEKRRCLIAALEHWHASVED
jgi:N-formylglutamate deformylase